MGLMHRITEEITYHHPTFLYESLWNFCGFLLLHFLSKRRKYDGQIALGYVAWYGLGRALIEGLRTDSLYIPGTEIRISQLVGILCFVVFGGLLIAGLIYSKKFKDPEAKLTKFDEIIKPNIDMHPVFFTKKEKTVADGVKDEEKRIKETDQGEKQDGTDN
jgi:prolipoprotein diacylglyceryltransferase